MPLHVVVLDDDSKFYAGLAQGNCKYFDTDKKKGLKGYFVNSILTGPNNVCILFTDTTFQYFIGGFINSNKPNGNMTVYDFAGNGTPLDEIVVPITVAKKNCIYSNGTLISVISTQNIQVNIDVTYKNIDDILFMTDFSLNEI